MRLRRGIDQIERRVDTVLAVLAVSVKVTGLFWVRGTVQYRTVPEYHAVVGAFQGKWAGFVGQTGLEGRRMRVQDSL